MRGALILRAKFTKQWRCDLIARMIVRDLVRDLRGRSGLGPVWEQIVEADNAENVLREWEAIVLANVELL